MSASKFLTQMQELGVSSSKIRRNLPVEKLVEISISNNEGVLTSTNSLSVKTGKYTGRSPNDRFIIYDDETHDKIDWGKINHQFPTEKFNQILEKMEKSIVDKEIFVFDGFVGADAAPFPFLPNICLGFIAFLPECAPPIAYGSFLSVPAMPFAMPLLASTPSALVVPGI